MKKIELVNMDSFDGTWSIAIPEHKELALIQRVKQETTFYMLEQDINAKCRDMNSAHTIITPRLRGETIDQITGSLSRNLRKLQTASRLLFFGNIVQTDQVQLANLLHSTVRIRQVMNVPGGKKVSLTATVDTPFVDYFLPRNAQGEFLNLEGQKKCLQILTVKPTIRNVLAEIMNHQRLPNAGWLCDWHPSFEEVAGFILFIRSALQSCGFKVNKKPLVITTGEKCNLNSHFYEQQKGCVRIKTWPKLRDGDFIIVAPGIKVSKRDGSFKIE